MRLQPEQLEKHLNSKGLSPVYCISGDEPLQMLEAADQIRSFARKQGFEERVVFNVDKVFDWGQLRQAGANLSLFSSKRLIELRMGNHKPGREGGAALADYTASADPDNILLITAGKLDKQAQQTRWYKALDAAGLTLQVWPVEPDKLPGWIIKRSRLNGKRISQDAANLIALRVEGNLLAARQELEKLSLVIDKPEIEIQDVMQAVSDSSRYEVFSMIEYAMQGKPGRTLRMLRGLQQEGIEIMAIFGALMWELRSLCSMACDLDSGMSREQVFARHRVWPQRKQATGALLNRMNKNQLHSLLRQSVTLDKVMKGAIKDNPWTLLENFMLRMAGAGLQSIIREP
jgi:DNA polymerase-3 subunit delta